MGIAARSGFSGLQAAVLSYCPQMESWVRSVVALAPSSVSLANFLWEPIQQQQQGNGQKQHKNQGIIGGNISSGNHHHQHFSSMNKKSSSRSSSSSWYKHSARKSSSATLVKLDSITEDSSDESDMD